MIISLSVIGYFVYTLSLRTNYKETALEINDAILNAKEITIESDGKVLPADSDITDYYNMFLLDRNTLVYKRKEYKKAPDVPENSIKLNIGDKSLVYSDLDNEYAILVTWNTPDRNVCFSVRSLTTFRQMKAYLKNYNRRLSNKEKP